MAMRKILTLAACLLMAPAISSAQTGGMTKVQLLALQQQLKEECGLAHATGRMDGPTRHAIAVCNKKYGTQGNGAALLRAMNIGFGEGEMSSTGMGSMMGSGRMRHARMRMTGRDMSMHDTTMEIHHATMRASKPRPQKQMSAIAAQTDSIMRADRDAHGHNQGPKTRVRDTAYSAVADSLARATKGLPPKKKN